MTGNLSRRALRTQKSCANLGTIAMGENQPVTGANQADDLGCGLLDICPLFDDGSSLALANEGISADRKKHGLHRSETRLAVCQLHVHQICLRQFGQPDEFSLHELDHDCLLHMQTVLRFLVDQ